jgi:hypothetical protein
MCICDVIVNMEVGSNFTTEAFNFNCSLVAFLKPSFSYFRHAWHTIIMVLPSEMSNMSV